MPQWINSNGHMWTVWFRYLTPCSNIKDSLPEDVVTVTGGLVEIGCTVLTSQDILLVYSDSRVSSGSLSLVPFINERVRICG